MMRRIALILVALTGIAGCASTPVTPIAQDADKVPIPTDSLGKKAQSRVLSHYLSSVIHRNLGQNDAAIRELRNTADLVPGDPALQLQLLATYYRDEDFQNAATMAERALKNNPSNVMLNIWLGRIYHRMDRPEDAIGALEAAIAVDPESAIAYEALAEIDEQVNDLVGATEIYETLIEIRPDSGRLFYSLGVNQLELGEIPAAQDSFKKVLSLTNNVGPAHFRLGQTYMTQENFETARTHFDLFLQSNPSHLPSRENILGVHVRLGNYEAAQKLVQEIIESSDVNTEHHLYKSYILLKNPPKANPNEIITPNGAPILGALFKALVHRQASKPYSSLIQSLDNIESDLEYECTNFLNDVLFRFDPMIGGEFLTPMFEELINEFPKSKTLHVVLARTLLSMNLDQEASSVLLNTVEKFGDDKWLYYYLATASENLKTPKETERHLRKCLEIDPSDPNILNFLGYLLAEENHKLDEAEKLLERALLMEPDNGFFMDSLGWIYFRQGKGEKAVEFIKRAIRLMPSDDAVLREHLGDAYALTGNMDRAIEQWERAIRLDPDLKSVQKKIKKSGSKQKRT
jgi:tetratricopeptide (TPR) repeat protein